MINFCHISPTPYLETFAHLNGAHLILAHLVETDEKYASFYRNLDDGKTKIMDNSAFEMFKLGKPMYPSERLVELGVKCGADYIVLTDYPKSDWKLTRDKAIEMIPTVEGAGFGTFYVPQSTLSDFQGLIDSIEWALDNDSIHLIGISILAAPIACGVNESPIETAKRNDAYKLQRFLSRWKVFTELKNRGLLNDKAYGRFHCLGMVDGPNEIDLLKPFHKYIYSWDSSAAIWAGLNGIRFDKSPTGLIDGKFEKEVNFDYTEASVETLTDAIYNACYINNKLGNRYE